MPFKQLTIETCGQCTQPPKTAVRIKRQSDRKFYDASNGSFQDESNCINPWVYLKPSASPFCTNILETHIDLDPIQWTDGDYTIYFHDMSVMSRRLYAISEVTIFDGDSGTRKAPSVIDIARRVLDARVLSHKLPGSVGAWMIDVTQRLQAIQDKLGES